MKKPFHKGQLKCSSCGAENSDRQDFCGQCGAKLDTVCQKCGANNPSQNRFCGVCGHNLALPFGKPSRTDSGKPTKRHILRNFLIAFACIVVVVAVGIALINRGAPTPVPTYPQGSPTYSPAPVQQAPSAPSGLSGQANSPSQITVRWTDNSNNEDGFRIYRNGSLIGSVRPSVTMFQDTGLQYGTSYAYSVAAYNAAGEARHASTIQVKTLNPPITVTLDKIGVLFDHDPLIKGPGEIYLILAISDGKGEPITIRVPPNGYISLKDNETKNIGKQVFSSDCIGSELKILGVAFESDDPMFEGILNLAGELVSKIGGVTGIILTEILSRSQPSEDNGALMKLAESPTSDDLVGAIGKTWTSAEKWGLGSYEDVRSGDLRLWYTISIPGGTTAIPQPPASTPLPGTPAIPKPKETVVSFAVITNIKAIADFRGATITWTTDQLSSSQVEYGTDTSYGKLIPTSPDKDPSYKEPTTGQYKYLGVTSHTVDISGLNASTTYHYRVKSKNRAGKEAVSADQTFTTLSAN